MKKWESFGENCKVFTSRDYVEETKNSINFNYIG